MKRIVMTLFALMLMPIVAIAATLSDGLVAHYKFDGNAKDSSGNANDGVVHGATLTTDRFGNEGKAVYLGWGNWIQVADSESLRSCTQNITIALWAKVDGRESGWPWNTINYVTKGAYGSHGEKTRQFGLAEVYGDDGDYIAMNDPVNGLVNDYIWTDYSGTLKAGVWRQVVMTYNGACAKTYINGELVASSNVVTTVGVSFGDLYIGKDLDGGGTEYCKAAIDDVRIYNRALSANEVRAIFNDEGEPLIYRTVAFDANGGVAPAASRSVKNGGTVGELPTATRAGYDFLGWFTSPNGGAKVSGTTVVTADVTWYAHWQEQVVEPTIFTVQFNANGGTCTRTSVEVGDGAAVGTLPTARWTGYDFLGWFTAANGGMQVSASTVVTEDATWYAHWQEQSEDPIVPPVDPGEDDEPMDASIANTYDGVIVDADGLPMGYVTVKAAKASGKGDAKVSKVTATIQMAGETKKVTVKANVAVAEATMTQAAADGRILDLTFSRYGIWGTFDDYEIDGVRNLLLSTAASDKGTDAKSAAESACNALKGNYVMAYGDENGYNGLSVTIMAKGKVKVSGKLSNGTSVSTTSQLIVGEDYSIVPVIYTKKDTSLAFNIYFSNDGSEAEVFGYYDAVISSVSGLESGLLFNLGDTIYDLFDESYMLCDEFLPYGLSVESVSATKWSVASGAKAGVVKVNKDGEVVDTKDSENPSGLKLTFSSRAGTFSGSFKVYALDSKGKLKTFTATVSGVVVDGLGYGVATIKGLGSVAVTIE